MRLNSLVIVVVGDIQSHIETTGQVMRNICHLRALLFKRIVGPKDEFMNEPIVEPIKAIHDSARILFSLQILQHG